MNKMVIKTIFVLLIIVVMLFGGKLYPQNQGWYLSGPPGGLVSELAVVSNNPNAVIAANNIPFTGLLKSIDGGKSWEVLNGGLEFILPEAIYHNSAIYSLAVDMVFPDTMFIGIRSSYTDFGFYKTNGLVYASPESGGLLVSYDGGETWQHIAQSCPTANRIVFDPQFPDTLYAGTVGHGLYKIWHFSSDVSSYRQIGFQGTTIRTLDVFSSDTSCMVVVSANDSVYVSLDRGQTWMSRSDGLYSIDPLNEALSLVISPENPQIIYAGTCEGMYKTLNQGLNWFPINEGLEIPTIIFPQAERVVVVALAIDPDNPSNLYAGTDGMGLFKTIDAGEHWYLTGIPTTFVTGLSVSLQNPKLVYAGADHGFYVRRNGRWSPTTLWSTGTLGIKSVAICPVDSNLVIATHDNGFGNPRIYKSTDGGETWVMTRMLGEDADVVDIVFDPLYPERVYAISSYSPTKPAGLLISDNSGSTWRMTQLDSLELGPETTTPLAIDATNTDKIYMLDIRGEVYKSTDRALTWTKVKSETDTAHCAITIDSFNPKNIYLGTYGLWKSSNGGNTWSKTGPKEWVVDIAFDENSGYLYAATYGKGVFFTADGGENWDSLYTTPNPYLRVIDIGDDQDGSIIYVGSFGTGVFEWSRETTPVLSAEIDNKPPAK
ncbi:MAG: hypothetical protein AMJ92_08370, partial [candidate division Zixibacteria bacterium SM23_81]